MDRIEVKTAWTVTDAGEVEGLASVFGTADLGGDVVHKGAFAGAKPPLPMLASHDQADVVGVWDALEEVPEGLRVKGRLLVNDVARAAEVRALILSGAMSGLSIGYVARKAAKRVGGGRDLRAVDLLEVSVVAVPMHPGARILSAKSEKESERMDPEELEKLKAEIEVKTAEQVAEIEAKNAAQLEAAVLAALKPLLERVGRIEAKSNRAGGGGDDQAPTVEQKAFAAYLQRGNLIPPTEAKALTISSDPNGGYMAPPELSAEVIKDIIDMSPMRSIAAVRGTNSPSVIYPKRGPMGNATWDDETDVETETTQTAFMGQLEILTKGMSTFVDIPNSLLQDAPGLEAEVKEAITEDFALKEAKAFIDGDGIKKPEGIMTNSEISFSLAGGATITSADPLITLLYSIAPTYRGRGAWMMNGTTLGVLRKLKDANGAMLWQPSMQAGQPETILGRPVIEAVDMPDIGAGTFPIIYGDFSGYRILDRLALSCLVDPYSQSTRKVTRYHFGRRVGGRVMQPIKFKKLKMA